MKIENLQAAMDLTQRRIDLKALLRTSAIPNSIKVTVMGIELQPVPFGVRAKVLEEIEMQINIVEAQLRGLGVRFADGRSDG
jgi:hypothetical protein